MCCLAGIQLEALAYELCGTVIRQIEDNSIVAKDGRLKPGDLILYLNHECMWRVTCSQAKTILRRAELVSSGIPYVLFEFNLNSIFQQNKMQKLFFFLKKYEKNLSY